MTAKELAQRITGRHYMEELSEEEEILANKNGLIVVFGASDDLMELRGAINAEYDALNGWTCFINPDGTTSAKEEPGSCKLSAIWDKGNGAPVWTYETEIPHETFLVMDDGEPFCEGIVFALQDIGVNPEEKVDIRTLQKCPFCGGEASILQSAPPLYRPEKNHPFHIECQECQMLFGWDLDYGGIFDTEEEAAAAWNRRT